MATENLVWNKILTAVLRMPGVKVDRVDFLQKQLKPYCNASKLALLPNVRPYALTTDAVIDKLARACVNRHTALATTASTLVGLPGGLAMAATMPADLTQYYFHVFVLSQKLAYLYGFPDFADEHGELSDVACDLLTIFVGVMMGAKVADKGISELSKAVAESAVTRMPRVALTRGAVFPIANQIARMVGMRLSKDSFARGVGRFIPVAGGLFSGTLTLATFTSGARRLQKRLKAQKMHFDNGDIDTLEYNDIKASLVKAERSESRPQDKTLAVLQAMVNMANLDDDMPPEKYRLLETAIAKAHIDGDDKLELLGNVGTDFSYDIDYKLLACDPDYASEAIHRMVDVMKLREKPSMAERMYLNMTAKTIGVSNETLQQWTDGLQ